MPLYSSIKTKTNGGSGLYSEVLKRKKQEAEEEAASIADAAKSRIESIAEQKLIHANRAATEPQTTAGTNQVMEDVQKFLYNQGLKKLDEKYKGLNPLARANSPEYKSDLINLAKNTGYYDADAKEPAKMYDPEATESVIPYLGEKAKMGLMEFGSGLSKLNTIGKSNEASKRLTTEQIIQLMQDADTAEFAKAESENVSGALKAVGDVVQGSTAMIPTVLMSAVSPGMGLAQMAASAAGSSAQEALSENATKGQALAYGALAGGIEAGTEKLFGGIPLMKGVGDNAVKSIVKPIKNKIIKSIIKRGIDGIGEAVEEVISGALNPYAQRLTFNPDADTATTADLAYAGAIGFGVSALLGLPTTITDAAGKQQKTIRKIDSVDSSGNILIEMADDSTITVNPLLMNYEDLETLKSYLPDAKDLKLNPTMKRVKDTIQIGMDSAVERNEAAVKQMGTVDEQTAQAQPAQQQVPVTEGAPVKDAAEIEMEEEFQKEMTTARPEAETEALAEELRNTKPIPKAEQPTQGAEAKAETEKVETPSLAKAEQEGVRAVEKSNKALQAKIDKAVEGQAFENAMNKMEYKTLDDLDKMGKLPPKNIKVNGMMRFDMYANQKLQFEALTDLYKDNLYKDKSFVKTVTDSYNADVAKTEFAKQVEDSFSKENWEVPQNIILERGSRYVNGKDVIVSHKEAVEQALKDGKNVPNEVLKDYPDLAKQYKAEPSAATEQKDYPGMPKSTTAEIEAIEEEFFGHKLLKIDLQKFAEKIKSAQDKLIESFEKEKDAIRWTAKEKQSAALDRLSQKYDTKIDKLNSLLDAEKYKNFWKSELDKKELRDRIDKLRTDKNEQITAMKKKFSEKLKKTKKEYMLKKTEAISKLKEKARDKAAADKAKAAERAEINKKFAQLREIGTKRLKYMRPEYKKKIEAILSMFDITAKSHTSRKLAELQKLKQYIEDNPEHNIPERLLNQLNILSKKTASQITKEEFDNIYNAVMHLAQLEQLKDQLIINGRHREAAEIATEASENVLEGRKIRVDPTSIDTNKPEFSKNYIKEFFQNHLNPETLSIMSDQRSKGIIKKILFDDMYEGHSNEVRYKQDAYKIFEDFLDGLGNDIRSWSRSFNKDLKSKDLVEIPISKQPKQSITKIRITKAERLYLYLAFQDADAKRSMLRGGVSFGTNLSQVVKLTEADMQTIADSMSQEEKQFATLADKYFADFARPRMNEVFLDLNGYELIPKRKGYVPIKRHQDFLDKDYLKMRNKSTSVSLEGMGVLKERVKSSTPIVADDIFRVLVEHIEKISAYTGLAKPLRNAKMLMENTKLKNAYRQVGMYNIHMQLNKYIQDVETKSVDLEFIDKLGYSIQNKFATSALGLNPFTILKQFSAYALETNEISPKYLLKAQFTKTATDEIKKYSPILAERAAGNVSLELGDIGRIARIRRLFGNYKDIPQLLTKGIVAADRQIIGKTWNAVKMMIKEENPQLSEEDLLEKTARKTEEIVRHTNSASTMYDRSSIARSRSLFTRAATMFTSQTNIMFNSTVQATLEYNQSEKTAKDFGRAAKKLVTILVIANIMEQSIDQLRNKIKGKDDDDEKNRWNIPLDIVEGILNQVYFVGKIFSAYRSKTKYGKFIGYDVSISQLQIINQMLDYATDITTMVEQVATKERYKSGENKGKLKWKKTLNGLTDDTFSILSRIAGLPYDSVKSLVESFKNKID